MLGNYERQDRPETDDKFYSGIEADARSDASLNKPNNSNYSRSQKIAVVCLAFFALFTLVFWMIQFRQTLYGKPRGSGVSSTQADGTGAESSRETNLRLQDTDGDGLSDYDELYIYLTSPYLEDSDSDGFTDKEEIDSNNDPNCPIGRDCQGGLEAAEASVDPSAVDPASADVEAMGVLLNRFMQKEGSEVPLVEGGLAGEDLSELAGMLDAATLRQILVESGLDEAALSQISDEELMQSFMEVMSEQ